MSASHISRRDLLRLSALASLAPLSCSPEKKNSAASPAPAATGKKGLGITTKKEGWADRLTDLQCEWFYSWGNKMDERAPEGIEFVPMVFGKWNVSEDAKLAAANAKRHGHNTILGFNEPEKKNQSDISVEKALELWPRLMETGARLGSPGCVHPDKEWMKEFMAGVEERGLRVDFICMHSYTGPNADAFVRRLHSVHEMFGRPIWITEFAVGDWDAATVAENRHKPARVLEFMKELLPRLEALDFLERYAWFPAGTENRALGTSALFDQEGNLTPLGEFYRET